MQRLLSSLHFLLLAIVPVTGSAAGVADELPQMVGKGAEQLTKEHGATLRSLTKTTNENHFAPKPWHVWKFNAPKDEPRYVIFSGQPIFMIPGTSSASIILLSASGTELGMWSFSTGWRIDIKSASTSFDDKLRAQLITVSTAPVINGRDVAKQHFALVDEKLYFIRAEDSKGKLIRNHYLSPNHTLGGSPPSKDLAGLVALLESPQLPLRLAALTYLSGTHMNPDRPRTDVSSESVEDAKLARVFRMAESTKKRIEDYRRSDNSWLKEAADLAATPADESY
jgi:hypothetical protein